MLLEPQHLKELNFVYEKSAKEKKEILGKLRKHYKDSSAALEVIDCHDHGSRLYKHTVAFGRALRKRDYAAVAKELRWSYINYPYMHPLPSSVERTDASIKEYATKVARHLLDDRSNFNARKLR